ncbi:MAG: hypothetical protein JRD93_04215, partial [Deltaproteobacteria bacterium]|nr:hypothetical protein [Deltaproteobacteria bacterium]MBW2661198.1 hypothetical protein [Deltaproteobacteria bacterium]
MRVHKLFTLIITAGLTIYLSLAVIASATDVEPTTLTLDKAIEIATANNTIIKEAIEEQKSARADFFPKVSEAMSAQNRPMDDGSFSSQLSAVFGLGSRISHSGTEMLLPFRQNGKLHLSLTDCINIALERNPDIHLIEETLAQADADITKAWSVMLPFVGAEANYT